ncbi:MAG TPA: ATP-binding cassette domain-containing protein [Polyangiaceae bacterium]
MSKIYRSGLLETHALSRFSITIGAGEFVAVMGPSGSGKTTFLNVAALLDDFDDGDYRLDGASVRALPDANPLQCVDATTGAAVTADDFVFGYAEVFSFAPLQVNGSSVAITNANPVIQGLTANGASVDLDAGLSLDVCGSAGNGGCKPASTTIETVVPPASQELDQDDIETNGTVGKEEIWVDYYVNGGVIAQGAKVLYEADRGAEGNTGDVLTLAAPRGGTLWAVVHDDRGGVSWVTVALHASHASSPLGSP